MRHADGQRPTWAQRMGLGRPFLVVWAAVLLLVGPILVGLLLGLAARLAHTVR